MDNLSHLVPGLSLPSMGAGNTIDDPRGHELAFSGPGSESVNPVPDRVDNSPLPEPGPRDDYARLKSADGGDGSRPSSQGGGWTRAGRDEAGWRQV